MRSIKLHFPVAAHLTALLNDQNFQSDIQYLTPTILDNNNIVLYDPVTQHNRIDTELVVLSKFSRGIKRVIFSATEYEIEFLNPFLGMQKGGLVHNSERIIDSTDLEI